MALFGYYRQEFNQDSKLIKTNRDLKIGIVPQSIKSTPKGLKPLLSEAPCSFQGSYLSLKLLSCFHSCKSFVEELFELIASSIGFICQLLLLSLLNLLLELLNLLFLEKNRLSSNLIVSLGLLYMHGLFFSFFRKLRGMLISSVHGSSFLLDLIGSKFILKKTPSHVIQQGLKIE